MTKSNKQPSYAGSPRMLPSNGIYGSGQNQGNSHTRLHLTPNSIPPSPPTGMIHHSMSLQAPFVPNLSISSPPAPGNTSPYSSRGVVAVNSGATPPGTPINDQSYLTSSSPYLKATKSAVDTAISNERDRIKALEKGESRPDITVTELRAALRKERQYSRGLVGDLATLKSIAVASTLEAEVHEEGRINCLMRRVDGLQKEKGRIIVELEREEEMLTNTLQKKLNQVRREKAELQKQIQREHELKVKLESISNASTAGTGTLADKRTPTCGILPSLPSVDEASIDSSDVSMTSQNP